MRDTHVKRLVELADDAADFRELQNFILSLAVRGKLTTRLPDDGDAKDDLESILTARQGLKKSRGAKPFDAVPISTTDKIPGAPPEWEWIRLGNATRMVNGRAFKSSEWAKTGTPIIRIQNLNDASKPFNYFEGEVEEKHTVSTGDILLSWSGTPGTSFGAFIWEGGHAFLNQHIYRVDLIGAGFVPQFFRLAVNARLDEMIAAARGGVGLKHVTKETLDNLVLPLPPRAEQQRIADRYGELVAACDAIQEASKHYASIKKETLQSLAHSLSTQ